MLNWKKPKFIPGTILLCQFREWHTGYSRSKMIFLWSVVVKELKTRANCLWLWMSEEIVLIRWVSYEHLSSLFGLKGMDVATAALLENLFNFRLINMKSKKGKKYIKLWINNWKARLGTDWLFFLQWGKNGLEILEINWKMQDSWVFSLPDVRNYAQ